MKWLVALPLILSALATPLHASEATYPVSKEKLKSWQLPEVSYPESNPYQKAAEELGKRLFFDPRLTGDHTLSCAACHFPGTGWSNPLPYQSKNRDSMERQAPTLVNVAFQQTFFWDGRSSTLEDAVELHLKELSVISGDLPVLPKAYRQQFQQAFGDEAITSQNIARAIANFLRTLVVHDSPFDRWVSGDTSAISQSARAGFILFTGKAECVRCHSAPHFSDSKFHNVGLNTLDPGRFDVSGNPAERNCFRTASLRQASQTPPYMHMGSKKNLMSVIEFYSHGGDRHGKENELHVLQLSEQEERELLDFLMSLTGSNISIAIPQLPVNDPLQPLD